MDFSRYEKRDLTVIMNDTEMKGCIIRSFIMDSDINKHKTLKLSLETAEEDENVYKELNQIKDCKIEIYLDKNLKSKNPEKEIVFTGYIKKSSYISYGSGGCRFEATAYSKSEKMDREVKYRVFQDKEMSFKQIGTEIIKEYTSEKIEILFNEEADVPINTLIVQFGETDWEFLMRVASHLGMGIVSTYSEILTFGFVNSAISKNEDMKYTDYEMIREDEYIIYKIYSSQVLNTGDTVNIETSDGKNEFVIKTGKVKLVHSVFSGEYELVYKKDYKVKRVRNKNIRGCVIEGKVEKVFEKDGIAVMNVLFSQGLAKLGKSYEDYGFERYIIPYSVFYSSSNTGLFCTPEIGDTVDVFFPSEEEKFVRVNWSVNNAGSGRFSDYTKRNFHINKGDFNMTIDKNEINILSGKSCKLESPNIVEEADKIVHRTTQSFVLASDGIMGIEALEDLLLYGRNLVIKGKEESVVIESKEDIRLKGEKIHNN